MGIELVRLACPLVGSVFFERVMSLLDHLGHGVGAAALGLVVAVFGLVTRNRRALRAGLVVLLAVVVAGILANGLKLAFAHPRPGHRVFSYGFPSGHATTAFAVASVLGDAFPPAKIRVEIGPDQDTWKFGHRGIRRSVTIDGFDAEATKKELTTHLEVFRWYCPTADRTGMLVLRSPRPFKNDDAVWRVLLSFWEKIECHATDQ